MSGRYLMLSDQFIFKAWVTIGFVSAFIYVHKPQHLIHQPLFLAHWLRFLCFFYTVDCASCVRLQLVAIILPNHRAYRNLAESPYGTGISLLLESQ
jgi:hypothetical protein